MTIRWPHRCGGVLLLALVCASGPRADEGMWTFDNAPRKLWKERYGFEPTDAWLDHLRLSSVRLIDGGGRGGSASFVSFRSCRRPRAIWCATDSTRARVPTS